MTLPTGAFSRGGEHRLAQLPDAGLYRDFMVHLDHLGVAAYCIDCKSVWQIVRVNTCFRAIAGWEVDAVLPIPHNQLLAQVHPDDQAQLSCALLDAVYTGVPYLVEYRLRDQSGRWLCIVEKGIAERSESGDITLEALVTDMSASRTLDILQYQNEVLARVAYEDMLTGLPNRQAFLQQAGDYLRSNSGSEVMAVTLDIARFREINEGMGYSVGSDLLCDVSARLWESLVDMQPVTMARLDGDQFALLLGGNQMQFAAIVQQLQYAIMEPFDCGGIAVKIDLYVGGALYPHNAKDEDEMLRCAEIALYAAKHRESHCCLYESSMDSNSKEKLLLLTDLRRALNGDELMLYYQPKKCAQDGSITCCEALLRWQHPEKGMIPPGNFIPLVENSELIHPITYRVMQMSLEQVCNWKRQGCHVAVAINISAHNLMDDGFVHKTRELLSAYPEARGLLEMEITESTLMADPRRAATVLHLLAKLGITLAIDDFGTGYSSLAYLKKLPITSLKIDRSFVMDMEKNSQDRIIVKSTIDLAHNLGLSVVAEGVETQGQMDDLIGMGCDYLQGYFISKPIPVPDFHTLLSRQWQPPATNFSI